MPQQRRLFNSTTERYPNYVMKCLKKTFKVKNMEYQFQSHLASHSTGYVIIDKFTDTWRVYY